MPRITKKQQGEDNHCQADPAVISLRSEGGQRHFVYIKDQQIKCVNQSLQRWVLSYYRR